MEIQEFRMEGVLHIKCAGVFRIIKKSYGWGVYKLYDDINPIYMPFQSEKEAKDFLIKEIEEALKS